MFKKGIKLFLNILLLIILLILPYLVFAQTQADMLGKLKAVGETEGGYATATETSAAEYVGTVVKAFLSLLGIIFLILMLYAGYNWMIAHGDESKVEKAKDTLRTSIIGLIIILAAYAIGNYVFSRIVG